MKIYVVYIQIVQRLDLPWTPIVIERKEYSYLDNWHLKHLVSRTSELDNNFTLSQGSIPRGQAPNGLPVQGKHFIAVFTHFLLGMYLVRNLFLHSRSNLRHIDPDLRDLRPVQCPCFCSP